MLTLKVSQVKEKNSINIYKCLAKITKIVLKDSSLGSRTYYTEGPGDQQGGVLSWRGNYCFTYRKQELNQKTKSFPRTSRFRRLCPHSQGFSPCVPLRTNIQKSNVRNSYSHKRGFTETSFGLELGVSLGSDHVYPSLSTEHLVETHLQPHITLRKWIYKNWQDGCWPSKAGRPQILFYLAARASCFLWLQVEGEDGVPRDPVTVTWLPYFKVPLTTGKEQPQSE